MLGKHFRGIRELIKIHFLEPRRVLPINVKSRYAILKFDNEMRESFQVDMLL